MSTEPYKDPKLPVDRRLSDLMQRMSLPEKLAQLRSVQSFRLIRDGRLDEKAARVLLADGAGQLTRIAGSGVSAPRESARIANGVQRFLREHTRLGIPAIVHEESCAGVLSRGATQFPQAIGLAASFSPDLVSEVARVIGRQLRAIGARLTLAPVLDVARDPRWGRAEETFGEDAYLVSRLGVAYIRGVQASGVMATGKHFMGYGAPAGGRNWGPSSLGTRELLERVLPPFEAAVREAKVGAVMNGYHEIDGVPCAASKWLLTEVLREQLGFEGVVVADYYSVNCLMTFHGVASSAGQAGAMALAAGLDVELPEGDGFGDELRAKIEAGEVDAALVDRALTRVLRQKIALGLFEDPFVDEESVIEVFDTEEQRALARRAACESLVLLKNDGTLPLSRNVAKVAVIGPNADSVRALLGDYSYPAHLEAGFGAIADAGHSVVEEGEPSPLAPAGVTAKVSLAEHMVPCTSVLEGIRARVGESARVSHALGCAITGDDRSGISQAVAIARDADVAVVVVGGRSGLTKSSTVGEARDASDLSLTGVQAELVGAVADTGTPVVAVVVSGRLHALADIDAKVSALLYAFCPGEEGGSGVADVLFGEVSPAGRLPMTLPRSVGQLPLFYNHKPSGAVSVWHGDYADGPVSALYPFGYGLGYTRFVYRDLEISDLRPRATSTIDVSLTVENEGGREGDEVVQLYVRDRLAQVTRPVMELKGFARLSLEPGDARRVTFSLDLKQLAYYDADMRFVVEPGEVEVMVGASSADVRLRATVTTHGETEVVERSALRPTVVGVR